MRKALYGKRMKNKIIGIFIVTLLILASALPLVLGNNKDEKLITEDEIKVYFKSNGDNTYFVLNDENIKSIENMKYSDENLCPNPSFEEGDGDLPNGWNHNSVINSEIYHWDDTQSYSGEKSIGVSGISKNGWYDWVTTDLIPVDLINNKYILSLFYNYSDFPNEGQKAGVWLEVYNKNGESLKNLFGHYLEYTTHWTSGSTYTAWISDNFKVNTSYIKIYINHISLWDSPDPNPSVEIRFDDVYFGIIENNPPSKPTTPSGPSSGKKLNEYTYSSTAIDPDNDEIYYFWDWGDNTTNYSVYYNSGDTCQFSHMYQENGTYEIRVKVRDWKSEWSEWSDPLVVSMPKNKAINPFILLLERLMERFPILEQILQPIYDKLTGF